MADWQRAAALDDVWDGAVTPARVGTVAIVLVRSGDGSGDDEVCAYRDACPHEKFPLSEWGQIENGVIVCQRHFWEFDVRTGKHITRIERPNCNLARFEVKVDGDDVLVDLDSAPPATPEAAPGCG
jgi:3-phenylpropionate/trans-cinnamate dioxygenase ferredoxin subunit